MQRSLFFVAKDGVEHFLALKNAELPLQRDSVLRMRLRDDIEHLSFRVNDYTNYSYAHGHIYTSGTYGKEIFTKTA